MKYVATGIGLVLANFIVQALQATPNYAVAVDRSWWEINALAVLALNSKIFWGEDKKS